jgi:hypothetical protein
MYLLPPLLFTLALLLCSNETSAASFSGTKSTIYIIRHAEKTEDGLFLSYLGKRRAECIADIFSNPALGINYILAPRLGPGGSHGSSLNTSLPLASRLGLDVDTTCGRNKVKCVGGRAEDWARMGKGSVLVIWRHGRIADIAEYLGVQENQVVCPEDTYDLIWAIRSGQLASVEVEVCPDLEENPEEFGYSNSGGGSRDDEGPLVIQE